MLQYEFPKGVIKIYREEFSGTVLLDINGKIYGKYKEITDATADVITACTNCPEWDEYRRSINHMEIEWENC